MDQEHIFGIIQMNHLKLLNNPLFGSQTHRMVLTPELEKRILNSKGYLTESKWLKN